MSLSLNHHNKMNKKSKNINIIHTFANQQQDSANKKVLTCSDPFDIMCLDLDDSHLDETASVSVVRLQCWDWPRYRSYIITPYRWAETHSRHLHRTESYMVSCNNKISSSTTRHKPASTQRNMTTRGRGSLYTTHLSMRSYQLKWQMHLENL